ncbi:MAG: hypothetical protein AB1733_08295 [Thermodesulfobacteriota bacterium]
MDFSIVLKSGFMGFALAVGILMLVFYLCGVVLTVARRYFVRVFTLAAVASFVGVYAFLHYKIRVSPVPQPELFLVGCIGGWLAGIFFGLVNLRRFLTSTLK